MAEICAFNGVRFNPVQAGDPSKLLSPPYDIIGPEQRRTLHDLSQYNYVRLVLGEDAETDTDSDNRFTRAGHYLREWLKQDRLVYDSKPSVYQMRIGYDLGGEHKTLSGLIALVKLHPYEDGVILPHERTLQGPKKNLARLMEATDANLDSVWMLYDDDSGGLTGAISRAVWTTVLNGTSSALNASFVLERCDNPDQITPMILAAAPEQLIIADGHHRYETALAYAERREQELPETFSRPWQWAMATLTWADDPGLTVLPTHRVVRSVDNSLLERVPRELLQKFELRPVLKDRLEHDLANAPDSAFACWDGSRGWLALPREPVDALGAELVQECVLAQILGFDVTRLKSDERVLFVEETAEAVDAVDSGQAQAAFLLKPISVRTITRYAREGRFMPQKSTYFYPKLPSGLVLRVISEDAPVAC